MQSILFLNQGSGQLFREFVLATAEAYEVIYYTPDTDDKLRQTVHVVQTPVHDNRSIVTRLWRWLRYLVIAGTHALRQPGRPLLFIVTNPPLAPVLGLIVYKLKRQPYILLYYDMYPETIERFGGLSRQSLVSRIWRKLNRSAIAHAADVVTISPQLAETVKQYLPDHKGRTSPVVIPTWVDTDLICPIPKHQNWFAIQHGQSDRLTILYSGNMGNVHDLSMVPAMAEQLRLYPRVHFLLIGSGAKQKTLTEECERRQLSNVTFLPYQPDEVLPFALACGDIALVALAPGGEGVSMPSKTYYMMAAGNALLGLSSPNSDLANVIHDHRCGVNVQPGDIGAAVDAIVNYLERPALLNQHRQQARESAKYYFSKEVCIPRMLELIRMSVETGSVLAKAKNV